MTQAYQCGYPSGKGPGILKARSMFISNGNGGGLNSTSSMEPDLDCQWIIAPVIRQQTDFISLIFDGKKTNLSSLNLT